MSSQDAPAGLQAVALQVEDPLIAALPPNTDYITYLTILEYQLTPNNLQTLNRLLQDDDGTLAAEIGWDLLKLVLPILRVNPLSAKQCLDIIARRGNPREVIVRVAEELERLGQGDSDTDVDPDEGEENLVTFAGEAPHVHLGNMTLQGMPPQPDIPKDASKEHTRDTEEPNADVEELKLQALLSMLSNLHPRIKTQYPSRFLATSLPAALTAYRNLSMGVESTLVFLNTLSKLAGKERPTLPPRMSTSEVLKSALLPDPESKNDSSSAKSSTSDKEQAIIRRLLQAVLLEIIDEHNTASYEAQPPLTARLRAALEANSLTSVRKLELEELTTNEDARKADALRSKFVSTSRDVGLDLAAEIRELGKPTRSEPEDEDDSHEYPTSPSQIPITTTGLLLLLSAQLYGTASEADLNSSSPLLNSLDLPVLLEAIDRQYETDSRLRQSGPAIDGILSLLFVVFCTDLIRPPLPTKGAPDPSTGLSRTDTSAVESQTLLLAMHNVLRDIFTTMPDADLRDNAYYISSCLLHGHCRRDVRLKIIKSLLEADSAAGLSPIHEDQKGNLKAIGIQWLKDELFPTPTISAMMQRMPDESERGLETAAIADLLDLLFPASKLPEGPDVVTEQLSDPVDAFARDLAFCISGLNLLCLLAGSEKRRPDLLEAGRKYLEVLLVWRKYYVDKLMAVSDGSGQLEIEGVGVPEIFSFDDACTRALDALGEEDDVHGNE